MAAKRMRLDTYHEDGTSVSLSSPHTEVYVERTHPNKVLEGLNRLRLKRALCDVILCCGGQEFPCHRYVLASFSPYFEAMFTSGMVESTQERVTISAVEPQMIGMLVNYAYTSEVSISTVNVQALLVASNLFDVMAIREACCDFMERHMDISNCVGIYCFAEAQSCKMLEQHSVDYILEHFSDIYQQEEFLSLSVEELTVIFASDHLNVPKEDMVFEAAMLWLGKCPTRRQNFEKVLEQIRLPLISPSYLHTVVESLDVVKEYQGCQRFISEAKDQPFCNAARPRRTTVILTVGGEGGSKFDKIEIFDRLTNQWKTLGRFPWKVSGHAVVKTGCTLYLAGGERGGSSLLDFRSREMWRYDVPSNSWLKMASMNKPRSYFSMAMLDGYMYAVGGDRPGSMERYDPKTNTWQLMESVNLAAHCDYLQDTTVTVALEGHLYLMGVNPWCSIYKVAKYNPETSIWTEVAPIQNPRTYPAVCTLNGKIFVIGGERYSPSMEENNRIRIRIPENTTECYNPKTNQWTTCAPMQVRRTEHGAVEVAGKIYVLGGLDESLRRCTPNIECYCEETDTWETVGQMPNARDGFICMSFRLRKDCAALVDEYDDDDDDYED